jgi:hypothetical protein
MFSTFANQPGVYRQLSLAPKYFFGNEKIVIAISQEGNTTPISQQDIFTAAVYRLETGAKSVVAYSSVLDMEKEIPTEDIVTIIEKYYNTKPNGLRVHHYNEIFVVTKKLATGIVFVELAGSNYSHLSEFEVEEIIDLGAVMGDHEPITSVAELLARVA